MPLEMASTDMLFQLGGPKPNKGEQCAHESKAPQGPTERPDGEVYKWCACAEARTPRRLQDCPPIEMSRRPDFPSRPEDLTSQALPRNCDTGCGENAAGWPPPRRRSQTKTEDAAGAKSTGEVHEATR